MYYLEEHGLVNSGIQRGMSAYMRIPPSITAAGMDFLADDGGLSAILGVITIKLHEDTLRSLIEAKINGSEMSAPEKLEWIRTLREQPIESIRHLTKELTGRALDHMPDVLNVIKSFLFPAS